jgi:hypothetical protein
MAETMASTAVCLVAFMSLSRPGIITSLQIIRELS